MVMICQQCGDRGFENAFVHCVKCLGFVIHRYCLDVLPKTLDEYVRWICDDCKQKFSYQSTCPGHNSLHIPEQAFTSSVNSQEIHSRENLKTNRDNSSLVDGMERDHCQETAMEKEQTHIPLADSPTKVNLKKRKKRHTDEAGEGTGGEVIRESEIEHVQLVDSPITLDSKRKKVENTACLLSGTEEISCSESIEEPDPLKMEKMRTKLRNISSLVDGAEEQRCRKPSPKLEHDSVPIAELCARAKSEKERRKKMALCSVSSLSGSEEANGHGELTKEPDLKEKIVENNVTCFISKKRDNELERSPNNSCLEACTTMEGVSDLTDYRKCQFDSSLQFVKAGKMLNILDHDKLVSRKVELDKTTKDRKCDASKPEDVVLNIEKEQQPFSQVKKCVDDSHQDVYVHAQPVIDITWTGGFDIANKDYDTYAVGHVSSKVGSKVLEEASLLPSSLSLEMLPKSDLWPKSFLENKPSDDHIALYFFPAGPKHERIFDLLVDDMRNEELAMRAVVTNAELLIFTSEELPPSYWKFNGKYYLWGVFRGKRDNACPPTNNHLLNSKGCDRCGPHTNSSKKTESGKRNLQDSNGSDRSDLNSSKKRESGKRNLQDSKGSDQSGLNSSKKMESGKRNLQDSKGSDRSDPNSSKKMEDKNLQDSKGSDKSDLNSSKKMETGKRNLQDSRGSDRSDSNSSKKMESRNKNLKDSKGSDRSDLNSSKKMESGKRNLQDSKGSDRSDLYSSKKIESGKRNLQDSKGSDQSNPRSTSSNKVESGKRNLQDSKGRDKSNPCTNPSSGMWKDNHLDKNFGGHKFSKSFKH